MVKVHEENMFKDDSAFGGKVFDWDGTTEWYYIERSHGFIEVIYADEKGCYYYGARDLSHIVPVLWNNRSSAGRVARINGGRVKKFPYTVR